MQPWRIRRRHRRPPNVRSERGEIIVLALFALITLLLLAGGIALSVSVKCDPKVQHCIDYGSGSVEAPK